jgi:ferredoxin
MTEMLRPTGAAMVDRAPTSAPGLRAVLLIAVLGLARIPQAACLVQLRGAPCWTQGPTTGSLRPAVQLHSARRTAARALLHMSSADGSAPGRPGQNKVPFRAGDPELVKAMAEAEAQAGNTTGAAALSGIADRMQAIMDRSTAKLARKLDVADAADADAERSWPFVNAQLAATGRDVWVASTKEGPKSARGPRAFEAGSLVTFTFRINQLAGPMCVGLTSLAVDLDTLWSLDQHFNEALYITQNGNLYNGAQLIWETGTALKTGDTIDLTLDGDMVYIAVNGDQIPATLGPISGSLRPTVQLHMLDDGISLVETRIRAKPASDGAQGGGVGTLTMERNKRKGLNSLDDETSIISSLFSNAPDASAYTVDGPLSPSDISELSADEPLDIFAINQAPQAAVAKVSWEMLVSDSGRVYYWNKDTNETSWSRPADYLDVNTASLLRTKSESEAGRLLDRTAEDTGDIFFNNADAALDSWKTVKMDEDGYPVLDRFVHVDEETCIGCTNCATVARSTFFMEDTLGRARVFRQAGDSEELIAEAVDTCPVDCIWYVSWDDLVILETERKFKIINNQKRLVTGSEASGWNGRGGWGVWENSNPTAGPKRQVPYARTRARAHTHTHTHTHTVPKP